MDEPNLKAIRVREAGPPDHAAVRQCMAEVFRETAGQKTASFGEPLWRWQYLENRTGSIIVMAEDGETVCGYYHILLFPMRHDGQAATAAMVQDVGTRREYRRYGIFRQMGAFALDCLRARSVDFIYTFPNNLSLPSFVRNHAYTIVAKVPVYVLPLRSGPFLAGRFGLGVVGRAAGFLFDPAYRMLFARERRLEASETLHRIESFDEQSLPLTRDFANLTKVNLERTADYLNWRFFEKPTREYSVWGLHSKQQLRAYVVTRRASLFSTECVLLMDFGFRSGEEATFGRLVSECVRAAKADGAALAVTMGLHPAFSVLGGLGFLRVPERFNPRTFNLLAKEVSPSSRPGLFDGSSWTITLADWDVF